MPSSAGSGSCTRTTTSECTATQQRHAAITERAAAQARTQGRKRSGCEGALWLCTTSQWCLQAGGSDSESAQDGETTGELARQRTVLYGGVEQNLCATGRAWLSQPSQSPWSLRMILSVRYR